MKSIKTAIAMSAIAGAAWSGVSFAANDAITPHTPCSS